MILKIMLTCILVACLLEGQQLSPPVLVTPSLLDSQPQFFPALAYAKNAGVWLAVWQHGNPNGDETSNGGKCQDIYCARIDTNGTVLDPAGIAVCTAADFQCTPSIASNGDDVFIVRHDLRKGVDWDVYGARVTSAGQVLDPDGKLISGGDHNQCYADIVYAGGNYYTAWMDARHFPEYRIFGSRITSAGQVLDGTGTELIRFMTDDGMAGWASDPFSPGKGDYGWNNHMKQAGVPTLATNDSIILVIDALQTSGAEGTGLFDAEEYYLRKINPVTGIPDGIAVEYPVRKTLALIWPANYYVRANCERLATISIGANQPFLSVEMAYEGGFGCNGGILAGAKISANGLPAGAFMISSFPQAVYGYRCFGMRSNSKSVACDGNQVLCAFDRYAQASKKQGSVNVFGSFLTKDGAIQDTTAKFIVFGDTVNAIQSNPKVNAGPAGVFMVLWQEESRNDISADSRIKSCLVRKP